MFVIADPSESSLLGNKQPVTQMGKGKQVVEAPGDFTVHLLHFNDAYNIEKAPKFVTKWREFDSKNTLKLFSGDIYSPSNLSSDFYGSQFQEFIDIIGLNAGAVGNHEFDYGEDRFKQLALLNPKFHWLNSNLIHSTVQMTDNFDLASLTPHPKGKVELAEEKSPHKAEEKSPLKEKVPKKESPIYKMDIMPIVEEFLRSKVQHISYGDVRTYKAYEVEGVRICLFAMADSAWLSSSHLKHGTYALEHPVTCAKRMGDYLRFKKKCELVIALTHMNNANDKEVLAAENEVDFILGGHEHMYWQSRVNKKFVLKSGADFSHFTKLTISKSAHAAPETGDWSEGTEFEIAEENEPTGGRQVGPKGEKVYPTVFSVALNRGNYFLNVKLERVKIEKNVAPDAEMTQSLEKIFAKLPKMDTQVFEALSAIDVREEVIRSRETRICNWVTDLLRLHAGTDLAMLSSGGFRLAGVVEPGSKLTIGDIRKLLPFPDEIMKISLSGDNVIEFLEQGINAKLELDKPIMAVSGITCEYDPANKYQHRVRVDSIRVDGQPLDRQRIYTIAVTKFVAGGKDGFSMFAGMGGKEILESITPVSAVKRAWEDAKKIDLHSEFVHFRNQHPGASIDDLAKGVEEVEEVALRGPTVELANSSSKKHGVEDEAHKNRLVRKRVVPASRKQLYFSLFSGMTQDSNGANIWALDFSPLPPRIKPADHRRNLLGVQESL